MWFGITVSTQFYYTTITFYAASDSYTPAGTIKSESVVLPGYFVGDSANAVLNFGCNMNMN
jgi:hypothetical protein